LGFSAVGPGCVGLQLWWHRFGLLPWAYTLV
jgi:hypothetical protein